VECEAFDDASRSAAFLIERSLGRLCGGRAITTTDGVEVAPVDFTPHIVMWAPREAARVSALNSIAFCAIDDRRRGAAPDLGACDVRKDSAVPRTGHDIVIFMDERLPFGQGAFWTTIRASVRTVSPPRRGSLRALVLAP